MRDAFSLRSPKAAELTAAGLSSAFARDVLCAALAAIRLSKSVVINSRIMANQLFALGSVPFVAWCVCVQTPGLFQRGRCIPKARTFGLRRHFAAAPTVRYKTPTSTGLGAR